MEPDYNGYFYGGGQFPGLIVSTEDLFRQSEPVSRVFLHNLMMDSRNGDRRDPTGTADGALILKFSQSR